MFFVVAGGVLWCCVFFWIYTCWKYHNTIILRTKTICAKQKWKWRLANNKRNRIFGWNANSKYAIRGLKRHLPDDVAVAVSGVLFFVLLLRWFVENNRKTKIKLKVSVKLTEQKNCGNAHRKYVIRGFDRHLPYAVAVAVSVAIAVDVAVDVADVLFFVMLLHLLFEKHKWT